MRAIIDEVQKSDMGTGCGHYDFSPNTTLKNALDYLKNNLKAWGTITIYRGNTIVRLFDYELFNNSIFYHHLAGWEYNKKVKAIDFRYCFMNEDIYIYIE